MIAPGQKLGRYHLREPLGCGGMSAVYRAYDPILDREVAVKILPAELAQDATFRDRFHEEARTLGRVEHPNLVRIFAVGQDGHTSFYAMELIAGKSLRQVLTATERLTWPEAAAVVGQVLKGLDAVHRTGIVHRDIKPGNIMLDASGRAVLMDFGLARRAERQSLTAAGAVLGTPEYMSPEQARGEKADARSDLYAIGILLHELLCGRPPFSGKDTIAILRHHVETPPPPLLRKAPDAPPALEEIVARLLAKNPAERYPHTGLLADALSAVAPPGLNPERTVQELLAKTGQISSRATRTVAPTPRPASVSPTPRPATVHPTPHLVAPVARRSSPHDRIRTAVAVTSAVVAVLALLVAIVALIRERPASRVPEPAAAAVTPDSTASPATGQTTRSAKFPRGLRPRERRKAPHIVWHVIQHDGMEFDGVLQEVRTAPNGEPMWMFLLPDGDMLGVRASQLSFIEQKGGESP